MPTVHKRVMLNVPQDMKAGEDLEGHMSMAQTCLMLIEAYTGPKYKEILHTPEEPGDGVARRWAWTSSPLNGSKSFSSLGCWRS